MTLLEQWLYKTDEDLYAIDLNSNYGFKQTFYKHFDTTCHYKIPANYLL